MLSLLSTTEADILVVSVDWTDPFLKVDYKKFLIISFISLNPLKAFMNSHGFALDYYSISSVTSQTREKQHTGPKLN